MSAIAAQFPEGWRSQFRFLESGHVRHIATAMVFSVSIGPMVEPPERRKALVSVIQESVVPIDADIANLLAAQATKLVLES